MQIEKVGRVLDANSMFDRIKLVTSFVNLHRVLRYFMRKAPPAEYRMAVHRPIQRPFNTTIVVDGRTARKVINDCDSFFVRFKNSFAAVAGSFLACTMRLQVNVTNLTTIGALHSKSILPCS